MVSPYCLTGELANSNQHTNFKSPFVIVVEINPDEIQDINSQTYFKIFPANGLTNNVHMIIKF